MGWRERSGREMERAALSWAKNKSAWRFKGPLTLCLVGGWREGLGGGGDARWGKKNGVSGRVGGERGRRHASLRINFKEDFSSCPLEPKTQDLRRG